MPKKPTANHTASNLAKSLLESEEYRSNFRKRLEAGILPPNVEAMLWHYAYGKPTESIEVNHSFMDDLEKLTDEELDLLERELRDAPTSETVM